MSFGEDNLTLIITSIVAGIIGIFSTKVQFKSNTEKTHAEASHSVFNMYREDNERLREELKEMRQEVETLKENYSTEKELWELRIDEAEDALKKSLNLVEELQKKINEKE